MNDAPRFLLSFCRDDTVYCAANIPIIDERLRMETPEAPTIVFHAGAGLGLATSMIDVIENGSSLLPSTNNFE